MNKACLVLIVALSPATLFAGETMVTSPTIRPATGCNFRVDKCDTSVATDSAYVRFKDGTPPAPAAGTSSASGNPSLYKSSFVFMDYSSAPQQQTVEELVALIRSNLSNCPEVTVFYDNDSGNITVHYVKSTSTDCDWVVNVRNVKAGDFVWTRTTDNYSPYLGQMERQKFHCTSEQDAQKIEAACQQICKINSWTMIN